MKADNPQLATSLSMVAINIPFIKRMISRGALARGCYRPYQTGQLDPCMAASHSESFAASSLCGILVAADTLCANTLGHELLKSFLKRRSHLFGVVNQDGAIIGIVTLEDVLESLIPAV